MGYTHYWYRKLNYSEAEMTSIVSDFAKLVPKLAELGVPLAAGDGKEQPHIDAELICFNGVTACGHPENSAVVIPWPSENASGVGNGYHGEQWFAGAKLDARTCDGDCSYETLYFPRSVPQDWFKQEDDKHKGLYFFCCKTAYRPYDLAVTAFLVIAKHHLGPDIAVSSDGEIQHWIEAIALCRVHLGYEESYQFSEDGGNLVAVSAASV